MALAFSLSEDMVRLHVIASSDAKRAQKLKMRIVMAVRKRAARLVVRAVDAREAFDILSEKSAEIARRARKAARLSGYFGKVNVECGVYAFPDCVYGARSVPAGNYRAVRVSIGKAKGHNWWCVVYPELCAVDQSVAEVLLRNESVEFFSVISRFIQNIFHGVGL